MRGQSVACALACCVGAGRFANAFFASSASLFSPKATTAAAPRRNIKSSQSSELTYLEGNSWLWRIGSLNILVDPVFDTLDFGVPALIRADKRVIDGQAKLKEVAALTDFILISQGFEDHCHFKTLTALGPLIGSDVRLVAPPSCRGVLEKIFSEERVTYMLPGDVTTLRKKGGAAGVRVRATTGALLGPPWQQKENGFLLGPESYPADRGSLYYEPHCMYDATELAPFSADVVITPVVQQKIGAYVLVDGGEMAVMLAQTLKARTMVPMPNGDLAITGPLAGVVRPKGDDAAFKERCAGAGIALVAAPPGKRIKV